MEYSFVHSVAVESLFLFSEKLMMFVLKLSQVP